MESRATYAKTSQPSHEQPTEPSMERTMGSVINGVDKEVMVPGLSLDKKGYPGFNPRREVKDGLTIDYDVAFRLRDGVTIYTDVYRPAGIDEPLPAVILWSAYGKHFRRGPRDARAVYR